jgi:predicted nucleic acid-binding protein
MLVIADTSPLHYLALIEHTPILPTLFERIIIPPAMAEELQRPRTPVPVRAWMASPPPWLAIRSPRQPFVSTTLRLGAGEWEVLSIAQELPAGLVLLDDLEARVEAERLGLAIMGTLWVLELAAERGLLDFPTVIAQLSDMSFHLPSQYVPTTPHCPMALLAQGIYQHGGSLHLPITHGFMGQDTIPLEQRLRQVPQAQRVAEAPQHHQADHSSGIP